MEQCGMDAGRPLVLHAVGQFGAAVARHLEARMVFARTLLTDNLDLLPFAPESGSTMVLATTSPHPQSAQSYMNALFRAGTLLIPLVAEGSRLTLGPCWHPGQQNGCWACLVRRLQRLTHPAKQAAEQVPELKGAAETAAAALEWVLTCASLRPGEVLLQDLRRHTMTTESLLPVHGCTVCASGGDPVTRTIHHLVAEFGWLWPACSPAVHE